MPKQPRANPDRPYCSLCRKQPVRSSEHQLCTTCLNHQQDPWEHRVVAWLERVAQVKGKPLPPREGGLIFRCISDLCSEYGQEIPEARVRRIAGQYGYWFGEYAKVHEELFSPPMPEPDPARYEELGIRTD